jgi:hypothetical protein
VPPLNQGQGCQPDPGWLVTASGALRWALIAVVLLALELGCALPFEPPAGALEFYPPTTYHEIWQDMETCTGLHRVDYFQVRWFHIAVDCLPVKKGDCPWGAAFIDDNIILLRDHCLGIRIVIAHEIIHLLSGEAEHEGPWWKCTQEVGRH